MNLEQGGNIIWWLLAALLPLSALLARRVSLKGVFVMGLGWVAIFVAVLGLFSYGREFTNIVLYIKHGAADPSAQRAVGDRLHIRLGEDGHFWVDARINNTPGRFLIDSGATLTTLSDDMASKAGLSVDGFAPGIATQTANGVVIAKRSSVSALTIGPIHTGDLPVVVSDRMNGVNVLGMNFLSRLKSWRVEKDEMVLEP